VRILHLSDLHFGPKHFWRKSPEELASALARDECIGEIDLVVISGDLTWSAEPEEFDLARRFTQQLAGILGARFLVVPGNHDLSLWDRVPSGKAASDPPPKPPPALTPKQRIAEYVRFLRSLERPRPSVFPCWSTLADGEQVVMLRAADDWMAIGVNSAALLGRRDARINYPIAISSRVLEELDRLIRLRSSQADEELRVFVLHHHLLPVGDHNWGTKQQDDDELGMHPDPSMVANSGQLQDWLAENGFHLVLHGHKHVAHGRIDRSWMRRASENHEIAILGAGSAGVERSRTPTDVPLAFNVIELDRFAAPDVRVAARTFNLKVTNGRVRIEENYQFDADLRRGDHRSEVRVFHGRDSIACHAAIKRDIPPDTLVRNFVSVVDDHEFKLPPTLSWKGEPADEALVFNSFRTLQPHLAADELPRHVRYSRGTQGLKLHFHLEHGKRLFNSQYGFPSSSPFGGALEALMGDEDEHRRSYVGLYRAEIDALRESHEPPPGLVGLQFIRDPGPQNTLSIVASFRYIELSFWWGVNMLEAQHLLERAHRAEDLDKLRLGSITFFAALARWETAPDLVARAKLDVLRTEEITELVANAVVSADKPARRSLLWLLQEKRRLTSAKNIDSIGLDELAGLITGLTTSSAPKRRGSWEQIARRLKQAVDKLDTAVECDPRPRPVRSRERTRGEWVNEALTELDAAIETLEAITK
jgi:3',5'-cyclic AMP phosphodiesterase CpdA